MHNLYLKSLRLKSYCTYEDHTFSFVKENGEPYNFVCFFGPNGIGKSSFLDAISLLSMNRFGRGISRIQQSLRKYVQNEDYDPTYSAIIDINKQAIDPQMLIEGIYVMDGKEYVVQMNEMGWIRNDLVPVNQFEDASIDEMSESAATGPWGKNYLRYLNRICHFVKSDNDLSLNNFSLIMDYAKEFEEIITEIMHWPAKCIEPRVIQGTQKNEYCTDFIIQKTKKSGKVINVHFKRMSAGEKKIAKSFSDTFNLMHSLSHPGDNSIAMPNWPRLILIDNVEMHAYYNRHVRLIERLRKTFIKQQIFATTHSGVLIKRSISGENDKNNELYIDLEHINL